MSQRLIDGKASALARGGLARDLGTYLAIGAVALSCAWVYRDFVQDDAFITYRYARNLANGQGFVYNPGEPVLGTTTPLYTVLLACLAVISRQDIRLISHLISVLSLGLAGIMLYTLGRQRDALLAAATALVFVSNPLLISAVGMETFFLICLMLLALKAYRGGRHMVTGLLLGLLLLTRLETAIFAGLLGADFVLRRKRVPYWLLASIAVFIPWLIFAWYTFGSIIPASAQAKIVERAAGHGFSFPTGALLWWGVYVQETIWYVALLPILLLGIYAALKNRPLSHPYVLLLIWSILYFAAASFLAGSFPWYYGPLVPGFAVLMALGAEQLAQLFPRLRSRGSPAQYTLARCATFAAIALGVLTLQLFSWNSYWVSFDGRITDRRLVEGQEIANWLDEQAGADESLAVEEIGAVGYYSNMQIIDLYGLVTPGLLPYLDRGRSETLLQAIAVYQPDYILAREPDLIGLLDGSHTYERATTFGEGATILYRRVPKPISFYRRGQDLERRRTSAPSHPL